MGRGKDVELHDFINKVKICGVAYLIKSECIGTVVIDRNKQIPEIVTVVFPEELAKDLRIRFRREKMYIDGCQLITILPLMIFPLLRNQVAPSERVKNDEEIVEIKSIILIKMIDAGITQGHIF